MAGGSVRRTVSESNDPPRPSPDEPSSGPFPESSLTPPPEPPADAAADSPADEPPPPEEVTATTPSSSWMEPAPPPPPAPFPPGYTSPPPPGAGGSGQGGAFASAEPGPGTYVLAGWWRRVGAFVIDAILIGIVALLIMAPLGIGVFATGADDDGSILALIAGFIVGMLVIAVVALAYAPVMMGQTNGKTVGRMVTGIRVVRADGKAITMGFAALREVAVKALLIGTVGGSITFGLASLLDVLWPLWDDENRALHDFVVNTRTVMG